MSDCESNSVCIHGIERTSRTGSILYAPVPAAGVSGGPVALLPFPLLPPTLVHLECVNTILAPHPPNVDHLPPPPSNLRQPASERPIALPSSWTRARAPTGSSTPKSRSTAVPPPNAKFTFTNWLRHAFGLPVVAPTVNPLPIHLLQNPYRARKTWPPDFHKLHPKQQFHFEKTFRRRAMLKWARPNWNKWVRRVQRSMLLTAMLYFVFIAEPDGGTPFDGFRVWFFGRLKNLGALSEEGVEEATRLEKEAMADRDRRLAEKRQKEQ
ncbi:hypothetical protein DV736_g4647, partial [Chaetothyriales sp. CBS 134916]